MPYATANGVSLWYEEHGRGAPILGVHGTPSTAVLWEAAARELADHGRCIVYDRRGFARSAQPQPVETLDLSDHVEDAVGLLDALSASPALVIGRSTGGLIALELARRFPRAVTALVLLEPAVFAVDPEAAAWARRLRRRVLQTTATDPGAAAEATIRHALGDEVWETLPPALHAVFAATSPAVLAEINGHGLDLGEQPLNPSRTDLAGIDQATLLVSAEDSPEPLRRVNDALAEALPHAHQVLVPGGHLIDPAHPEVLRFIDTISPPHR